MNGDNKSEYKVDSYAQGFGAAGMSNHYYYIKDENLYHVNAQNQKNPTLIATGVAYITFTQESRISGFLAFTNKNFKYINQEAA